MRSQILHFSLLAGVGLPPDITYQFDPVWPAVTVSCCLLTWQEGTGCADFGVEKSVSLVGLGEEEISAKLEQLMKAAPTRA